MRRDRQRKRHRQRRQPQETIQVVKAVQPLNKLPLYRLVDEEALELIHQTSLRILSEIGIAFYDDEALDILRQHGAVIGEDSIVRFDPTLIEEYVSFAPSQFVQLARNPQNNVTIGGQHLCFAPVYGPPYVYSLDRGRREATLDDFQNFIKLAHMTPYIHHSGGTIVEPTDKPISTRHLDMVYSLAKFGDKPFMGSVISSENAADSVTMAEIIFGAEKTAEQPAPGGVICL